MSHPIPEPTRRAYQRADQITLAAGIDLTKAEDFTGICTIMCRIMAAKVHSRGGDRDDMEEGLMLVFQLLASGIDLELRRLEGKE